MAPREVGQIGIDSAEGLDYVHDHGVVHRDINPSNIMMFDYASDTDRVRAELTDFRIAMVMEGPTTADDDSGPSGTAAYVSPEQARGEPLGPPSDIYPPPVSFWLSALPGSWPTRGRPCRARSRG